MTKYYLHGGYEGHQNELNTRFYSELLREMPNSRTVLLVLFAKDKSDKRSKDIIRQFEDVAGGKDINFTIADASPEIFKEQVKNSNLVFIRGGDTTELFKKMERMENLEALFKDKTVVGSSAGAYLLSKYHYTRSKDKIEGGFGFVPIKVLCHYTDKMRSKYELMKNYGEELPIIELRDYEFWKVES